MLVILRVARMDYLFVASRAGTRSYKLRIIVSERANVPPDNAPLLAEQIDALLVDIGRELKRRSGNGHDGTGLDSWFQSARDRFWERQFELIDEPDYFWFRLAAPTSMGNRLSAVILDNEIEIRNDANALIRVIPLRNRVDETTVSALFDGGYFHMTGAKATEKVQARVLAEKRVGA
jgi:hypothetical protein